MIMTPKLKLTALAAAILAVITVSALADDAAAPDKALQSKTSMTNAVPASETKTNTAEAKKPAKPSQADVASTTATFGKIAKTDDTYKTALDAHALADALKMMDKDGAFKGTVAKIFEPRGLVIVEFDEQYKNALTALVRSGSFTNFPALTNLVGKEVVVTGKFIKYRDSAEIVLEKPDQVKIVE
jgi:hypothetical protein